MRHYLIAVTPARVAAIIIDEAEGERSAFFCCAGINYTFFQKKHTRFSPPETVERATLRVCRKFL